MKRWPTKPLSDLLEISRQRVQPLEYPNISFNYVGLENVEAHTGRLLQYQPTPGAEIKSTKNVFHPGQILFGKLRPYLNKVHLAREDGICSTDIYVLNAREDKIDAGFASYFLRSPAVLAAVSKAMAGANLPRINEDSLLKIPILVPPLTEQQRLAQLLDEADELGKLRNRADQGMDKLIPALFHDMFGDIGLNTETIDFKPLGNFIQLIGGYAFKSEDFCDEGIPVIRIGNANKGQFDVSNLVYLPSKFAQSHARFLIKPGDIVLTLTGTVGKDDYGNVCLVSDLHENWFLNQRVAKIEITSTKITRDFLFWLFRQPSIKARLTQHNRGVRQANISNKDILELAVPLPPLIMQQEFAAQVATIVKMEIQRAESRRRLDYLFQSMLHRAFSGEL